MKNFNKDLVFFWRRHANIHVCQTLRYRMSCHIEQDVEASLGAGLRIVYE